MEYNMSKEVTHQEVMAFADQNLGKKINFGHLAQLTRAYKYSFIIDMMEKAVKEGVEKLPEPRRIQYVNTLCKKYAKADDMKTGRKVDYTGMSINSARGVLPKGKTAK